MTVALQTATREEHEQAAAAAAELAAELVHRPGCPGERVESFVRSDRAWLVQGQAAEDRLTPVARCIDCGAQLPEPEAGPHPRVDLSSPIRTERAKPRDRPTIEARTQRGLRE